MRRLVSRKHGWRSGETPPPPKPAPGWYADPRGGNGKRYFDGSRWTDQIAYAGDEPAKSGLAAGLLQLFLGYFGLGRFYLGYTSIGGIQLGLGLLGLFLTVFCFLGLVILAPLGIWVFIEGIMMIAGAIPDANGRKVR
ncbi:DUF2510 domain-containing protein [Mycolicibacterium helvum]|uniref:DUF2510 domain-containing protein n=1 Tax=Mycolicibacterium helvum TaxID=1534349 RepID=A0A7I7TBG5_9MYCO|nr:DUF2510 domain-containing protein [Mycolicibacterium helvum]BBY66584.1 hypothetical protein MHEL_48270 [Mycolicibacterium helvum]